MNYFIEHSIRYCVFLNSQLKEVDLALDSLGQPCFSSFGLYCFCAN